jgi:excisionase family DNA binding protein
LQDTTRIKASAEKSGADAPACPVLLDVSEVAGLLKCSARHVYRLAYSGRMPKPLKLGALARWNRDAIEQWLAAGCPAARQCTSR